jgi:hypothetical protein
VPPEKAVYTATTDGLLTESTLTELQDTGPLATMFAELRKLVTGKATTIEVKGRISQALIVKTRGTFTAKPLGDKPDSDPIMARAGFRLEDPPKIEPKDATPEARKAARRAEAWAENDRWLEIYRTREYDLKHRYRIRIDLRTQWLADADLVDLERTTRVNLDPDLKRKPVEIGEREGVLAFDTEPWGSLDDFMQARDALEQWKRCERKVLRTLDDWHAYHAWANARPAKRAANTRGGTARVHHGGCPGLDPLPAWSPWTGGKGQNRRRKDFRSRRGHDRRRISHQPHCNRQRP